MPDQFDDMEAVDLTDIMGQYAHAQVTIPGKEEFCVVFSLDSVRRLLQFTSDAGPTYLIILDFSRA